MIVVIDNVLDQREVAGVRQQLANCRWSGGISAGPQAREVKHNQQVPDDEPALKELRTLVMRALNRSQTLMTAVLPFKVLPPNFNRYTPEHSHYGKHTDSTLRPLPDGSYLRTDVSATLFLSNPDEYEGGELRSTISTASSASSCRPAAWWPTRPVPSTKSPRSRAASASAVICFCKAWSRTMSRAAICMKWIGP